MKDKINVCLINDSFPPLVDGVANSVVNYAHIINSELGSATVATPYYPEANDEGFDFDVVRFPSLDTSFLVGYRAGVPFSAESISDLKDKNFDIIHSHCPITSSMLGRILRDEIDKPLVFTYHTKFDIDIHNSLRGHLVQEGALKLLVDNVSASDEVWVVSDGAGKNLQQIGYQGDYIVMPNGVDFPKGRADEDTVYEVTHDYDLPKDVPVYLFVGRMMWYKGIKIILDAMKMLALGGNDFRMIFIGGGADKEEIVEYANSLGLDNKVIFLNPILDRGVLKAWYCRANLFLFPSTFDTNGLVVREAAACALPSVLVKDSCAAEGTKDFGNAFLIDENAESMYSVLKFLDRDFQKMRVVGENAMNELYISWEDSVKAAYERYGVVIDNYNAGRCPSHEKLTDQFFGRSADAISEIITIQNLRNELLMKAGLDLKAQTRTFKSKLRLDFSDQNPLFVRTKYEFEKVHQKTVDFISKYIDRYR